MVGMETPPSTEELRRRIEAARAYADISSQEKLAKLIEVSKDTLVRKLKGDYPFKRSELLAIADVCRVPIWFIEQGFQGEHSIDAEQLRLSRRKREASWATSPDEGAVVEEDPVELVRRLEATGDDEESRGHG